MKALATILVAVLSLALSACGSDPATATEPAESSESVQDANAQIPDETEVAVAEPSVLGPGDNFTIEFSTSIVRTVAYSLHQWDGNDWGDPAFALYSDVDGSEARSEPVTGPAVEVEGEGYEGTGPDELVLPEEITGGIWRVCPVDVPAADLHCVQLQVNTN